MYTPFTLLFLPFLWVLLGIFFILGGVGFVLLCHSPCIFCTQLYCMLDFFASVLERNKIKVHQEADLHMMEYRYDLP